MICPKCMRSQFVQANGSTHYICIQNPDKPIDETGCGAQFRWLIDDYIRFPHNVIFMNRARDEFFRKPYLELNPLGSDL